MRLVDDVTASELVYAQRCQAKARSFNSAWKKQLSFICTGTHETGAIRKQLISFLCERTAERCGHFGSSSRPYVRVEEHWVEEVCHVLLSSGCSLLESLLLLLMFVCFIIRTRMSRLLLPPADLTCVRHHVVGVRARGHFHTEPKKPPFEF